MCLATLSKKTGEEATCCSGCPPSPTRFHQPHRTTTVRNGQPARCIQGQVAMATESTCYAECLLPSRHRVHCRRNSQPARWPARLSTDVMPPHSCSDTYTGEESWTPPSQSHHPNLCVMFFSLLTPPSPSFLPPPPSNSPHPQLPGEKKKKSKQQQTSRVVFFFLLLLFLVVLVLLLLMVGGVVALIQSWLTDEVPAQNVDDASRSPVQMCAAAPCTKLILENKPHMVFVAPFGVIKLKG